MNTTVIPKAFLSDSFRHLLLGILLIQIVAGSLSAQQPANESSSTQSAGRQVGKSREEEIQLGSQTAKDGFQNEDEICDKLNNWQSDSDGQSWLKAMNYRLEEIVQVTAHKPHGEKADVELRIKTKSAERTEGISIKLVSNPRGFNQIDKRWLRTYADKWQMPEEVHSALKLFVGEVAPTKPGRDPRRMFLNELSESQQRAVVDFFTAHRQQIISDLFAGDGEHSAGWMMVMLKSPSTAIATSAGTAAKASQADIKPRWVLCTTTDAASFFGSGKVQITAAGSLKIGRITMQRKGGDNGRESANVLQFKINPAELFDRDR